MAPAARSPSPLHCRYPSDVVRNAAYPVYFIYTLPRTPSRHVSTVIRRIVKSLAMESLIHPGAEAVPQATIEQLLGAIHTVRVRTCNGQACHEKLSPGAKFHPRINYRNSHPAKNYPCLLFFILPHPFVSAPLATCQLD